MNKLNVNLIMKKEDIDSSKITDQQIVVVLDVLLATSTIVTCLFYGAKEIFPVKDKREALLLEKSLINLKPLLVGEVDGKTIQGFLDPTPLSLSKIVKDKSIILATTNGTIAIRKVTSAKHVLIASLLNGGAVAEYIHKYFENDYRIIVVCSGSGNRFCMEDFYGAGYFIHRLVNECNKNEIELTDSAINAKLFYEKYENESKQILSATRVGKMLVDYGLANEISYVSQQDEIPIVPQLIGDRIIV